MSDKSIALSAPIYSMSKFNCPSFLERETRTSPQLLFCGGGGSGKTGIHNFIIIGGIKRNATGELHLKKLVDFDTDTDLLHHIQCASNGRFLFGSSLNKTVIYRVNLGHDESPLELEPILTKVTDYSPKGYQHAMAVKKDDTTLLTGGNTGTLSIWKFTCPKDDKSKESTLDLVLLNTLNLFDHPIACISLNSTETHAVVGSSKGELAIVDLHTNGVTQRIQPAMPRLRVQSVHFPAPNEFVAIVNEGRQHTHVYQYVQEEDTWKRDGVHRIAHQSICASLFEEKNRVFVFGTNTGEIGSFAYPSFDLFKRFMPLCDMPITAVAYLPPNKSMITLKERMEKGEEYEKAANQKIDDLGWFVTSSVDYLISTVKVEKGKSLLIARIVYLMFLMLVIWWGVYMVMKALYHCLLNNLCMEKLLGTLAFKKVPRVERSRKRDRSDEKSVASEKKPKLLEEILNGNNPPSLFPCHTSNGIDMNKSKVGSWKKEVLPIARKSNISAVKYWKKEGSAPYTPPTDIPLHPPSVISYTNQEFEAMPNKNEHWDRQNTDYLFTLCRTYNLRWPVIMDMMSTYSSFQLEACLIRFYTITRNVLLLRRQQGQTLTPEEEFLLTFTMDASSRKRGRSSTDRSFLISGVCHDKEKVLFDKIRDIDNELNKICNIEPGEGYGPHDDLDAIPTVMKGRLALPLRKTEPPVYLKPTPGVTLRSARYDNTTASSYFTDTTQRRLLGILAEMNVQVPRMATKRLCDTLDRLKQDIVKMILLRKYMDQNNYAVAAMKPTVYQSNDTKIKKRKTIGAGGYSMPMKR